MGTTPKGFKQTDIGLIPDDWELRQLGDILEVCHGKSQKNIEEALGRYPIFATGGQIGSTNHYLYDKPSVLIGRKGTIDRPRYINTPFWTVDTLFYTKISDAIDVKFVYYKFENIQWMHYNEASGVPSLSSSSIKKILVAVPPLPEQQAIAKALSDMDDLIHAQEKLIEKKRLIKKGAMQELLTGKRRLPGLPTRPMKNTEIGDIPDDWEVKRLGDVGAPVIGLTYKPSDISYEGWLVLRSCNIQHNQLAFEDNVYVNIDIPNNLQVCVDDIVICVRNGSSSLIGKCAIVSKALTQVTFGAFMSIFRSDYNQFIFNVFQSSIIKKQINEHLGATINQITNDNLKSFLAPIPPLAEQKAISNVLSDMDKLLSDMEKELGKYREIKAGMMQELLTGRIRLVNNYDVE